MNGVGLSAEFLILLRCFTLDCNFFHIYRLSEYIEDKNNKYIKTYDLLCSEVQHMSSSTQLQKSEETIEITLEAVLITLNKIPAQIKPTFESILLDAVDTAFSKVSDSNSKLLYVHLKNSFGMSRETIPLDIDAFMDALEQVFGSGALLIESQIIKTLHSKVPQFKFSPKADALSFASYLTNIRSYINGM